MRTLVSLWFPDFAIERFIRGRIKQGKKPPAKGLPFALVEGGQKGLRLVAVNATARSFGLMRGMRLSDARAQLPELLTEPHEPEEDMNSLLGLCRWMERYSPWVAPDAPDGILLDVTGVPHLFGGEAQMVAEMKSRLAQYGFTARAGVGATIGAAWALARYLSSPRESGERKGTQAKLGGGEGHPGSHHEQSPGAPNLPVAGATGPFFSPLAREKTLEPFPSKPFASTVFRRRRCGGSDSRPSVRFSLSHAPRWRAASGARPSARTCCCALMNSQAYGTSRSIR